MTEYTMLKCLNWCVALSILFNIIYLPSIEANQENVFKRHYAEHRTKLLEKRDVYDNKSYRKPKSEIVEVKIPACKPKKHYVTSYISETLVVRSHCVQKVIYSSTREVVSSSTECDGYLCNPKIPYESRKDDVYSTVNTVDNNTHFPNDDSYSNVDTINNSYSVPYVNYSLPEESYSGNYSPGYGPPKQNSVVDPGNNVTKPALTINQTFDFPENYNSADSYIVTSETKQYTTPPPTTTAAISDNSPINNRNYTAFFNKVSSLLRGGFIKGLQSKSHIESSVTTTIKPTYFTAVIKDPGQTTPSSYVISPTSSSPRVTSQTSIYQPPTLELTYSPEPISLPYINYSLPEELYPGNYSPGYGPPKQDSEIGSSNDENQLPLTIYDTHYFPEMYSSVDPAIITPETTSNPSTTTNPYNTPSSNLNYTYYFNNYTSLLKDRFVKGFQSKPQLESPVTTTIKPIYFTAIVNDPSQVGPSSSLISPSSPSPQVTSHISSYQPTALDLSYYPEPISELSSLPYINYTFPEETYFGDYPPGYGPPKTTSIN